ncbi:MFS general substrate transporter [Sistotremastrum suecicum HHB10207 ss-3]|uniref:MFS general substrate transporter n=1 Tax=Sistotremastrum suecicum HHB10207 ss-3 TaxID=1314776 RepID=A0A165XLB1_9AGAM|nr:MFS general substrate transporter [Sistotremastrum suecicum HHB10207 ss-3]
MTVNRPSEATPLLSSSDASSQDIESERNGDALALEKRSPTPLPKVQLLAILFIQTCEPLTWMFFFPFLNQMILEYGISGGDEKRVGYYAGLVGSASFVAECVSVFFWGRLSDRIGRRPVLCFGLCSATVATIGFGFSRTLSALMLFRVVAGGLNGNIGLIKSMIADITDESNQARAFSMLPTVFAVASTIAPVIGGELAHPAERFPGTFGGYDLFKNYPYLLPCIIVAIFQIIGLMVAAFVITEASTSHLRKPLLQVSETSYSAPNHLSAATSPENTKPHLPSILSLFTSHVKGAIINHTSISLIANMQNFIQPLFMATSKQYGGLGMSPMEIGSYLGAYGIYSAIVQTLSFPPLNHKLGTTNLFRVSIASNIVLFALWPIMGHITKETDRLTNTVIALLVVQLALVPLERMAFSCSNIFIISAAPSRAAMGATAGLGQTFGSISRSVAPILAASLFALSIEKDILGGDFVYLILMCIVLVALVGTLTLPRVVKRVSE